MSRSSSSTSSSSSSSTTSSFGWMGGATNVRRE